MKTELLRWINNVSSEEKAELTAILDNPTEIKERFCRSLAFGTAGMRGILGLGTFRMNNYTVRRATIGLAQFVLANGAADKGVVIAYDTRRCSLTFALESAKVLATFGVKSYLFEDVRPVAFCSFAIRHLGALAGIMITASHNPKEYNGFKVYGEDGAQMSPDNTAAVVDYIEKADYFGQITAQITTSVISGMDNCYIHPLINVIGKTVDEAYFLAVEPLRLSKDIVAKRGANLKLVYTPLHGAGYMPITTILKRQGINVTVVEEQKYADTEFSTVSVPNPENKEALALGISLGNRIGASVVIGTDPDSDRMGVAVRKTDGDFMLLNGNQIGALLMDYILKRHSECGTMPNNPAVIKTIVTTTLADKIAAFYNVTVFEVLTGFKYIGEKIKEWEASGQYTFLFGYEESFGYLSGTHARDKDAVVSAMLFSEMVCYLEEQGKTAYDRLEELFSAFGYYYEANISIVYKGATAMDDMALVMSKLRKKTLVNVGEEPVLYNADYLNGTKKDAKGNITPLTLPSTDAMYYALDDGQFLCVRPSGTEPKLKLYVLTKDISTQLAQTRADNLLKNLKKEL